MPASQYQLDETWQEAVTIGVGKEGFMSHQTHGADWCARSRGETRAPKEEGARGRVRSEAIGSPHALLCIGRADRLGVNPPRQAPGCFSAFLTGPRSDIQGQSCVVGMGWGHDA